MDDVLGDGVGGRRLGAEDHGNGTGREVPLFDFQIFIDGVKGVHLLALVFVEPLDLDVENRVGINGDSLAFMQKAGQLGFVFGFDLPQLAQHRSVPAVCQQLFQFHSVPPEAGTDEALQIGGQRLIAVEQPAAPIPPGSGCAARPHR